MSNPLSAYSNPPVIEVVCGLNFVPLDAFKSIHIGLLWERFKENFPQVEEHPPLTTVIEQYGIAPVAPPTAQIQMLQVPPLPRVWFIDESGRRILQIQRDTFLHNWRKLTPEDHYPRFNTVLGTFKDQFQVFGDFIQTHDLGRVDPIQCELTYVNHIAQSEFWSLGDSLCGVFPDFSWRKGNDRFLPLYRGFVLQNTFILPDEMGRLYVSLQIANRKNESSYDPIIAMEMKARGIPKDQSTVTVWEWFDVAHEWIVRGFSDLTSEGIQKKVWGRQG